MKPLVETQNVLKLLDYFDNSQALWMYRDYRKVAISTVSKWGVKNAINKLCAIVRNTPENWRSENIPEDTRKLVMKYFSEDMNPYDATALFWLVRNRLLFELGLDHHQNVMMCRYEKLLVSAATVVRRIYGFVGCEYPSDKILVDVRPELAKRATDLTLSPEIDFLCSDVLDRLDGAHKAKSM